MEFLNSLLEKFWSWLNQDKTTRQTAGLIVIVLGGIASVILVSATLTTLQLLMGCFWLALGTWYLFWLKHRRAGLVILGVLLLAAGIATWLFLTAARRNVDQMLDEAQALETSGRYEASLDELVQAKNEITKSGLDPQRSPEAIRCLLASGRVEIALSHWEKAEQYLKHLTSADKCSNAEVSYLLGEIARLEQKQLEARQNLTSALLGFTQCSNQERVADTKIALGRTASIGIPNYNIAMESCNEAETIYNTINNNLGSAKANLCKGDLEHNAGRYAEAESDYQDALEFFGRAKYHDGEAEASLKLGDLYSDQALWEKAKASYVEGLLKYDSVGSTYGHAVAEGSLGDLERKSGSNDLALWHYDNVLKSYNGSDTDLLIVSILRGKGIVETHQGDFGSDAALGQADIDLNKSLKGYSLIGNPKGVAEIYIAMGDLELERARFQMAHYYFDQALNSLKQIDPLEPIMRAIAITGLADAARGLNDYKNAELNYKQALGIFDEYKNQPGQASVYAGLSLLHIYQHNLSEARNSLSYALALYREAKDLRGQAAILKAEGDLARQSGDLRSAQEYYSSAYENYRNLGDTRKANDVASLLK